MLRDDDFTCVVRGCGSIFNFIVRVSVWLCAAPFSSELCALCCTMQCACGEWGVCGIHIHPNVQNECQSRIHLSPHTPISITHTRLYVAPLRFTHMCIRL